MLPGIFFVVSSIFIASPSEALAPGKYCSVGAVPPYRGTTMDCLFFEYTSPTKASLGYSSANHARVDLHYNSVTVDEDSRIVLALNGKNQNPELFPYINVQFYLAETPGESNTLSVYPEVTGAPHQKLTREACEVPPGQADCSAWQPSPFRRALRTANGHFRYQNVSGDEFARVFVNANANPAIAALEIGGDHTKNSIYHTGVSPAALGPEDPFEGLQALTISSPYVSRMDSLFRPQVSVFYKDSTDEVILRPYWRTEPDTVSWS
ncbi:hypothetical protein FOZ60_017369 [Perkinsus olseni]|uniref:Protein arginine methyltransferase 10 n=1 Tax=Perkinsus olseni TaxID=32597 RepID=A0A7J6N0F1_PEROL|nr:hypothetical protein FOZ60_017369 [Perkinsus olseni]